MADWATGLLNVSRTLNIIIICFVILLCMWRFYLTDRGLFDGLVFHNNQCKQTKSYRLPTFLVPKQKPVLLHTVTLIKLSPNAQEETKALQHNKVL